MIRYIFSSLRNIEDFNEHTWNNFRWRFLAFNLILSLKIKLSLTTKPNLLLCWTFWKWLKYLGYHFINSAELGVWKICFSNNFYKERFQKSETSDTLLVNKIPLRLWRFNHLLASNWDSFITFSVFFFNDNDEKCNE